MIPFESFWCICDEMVPPQFKQKPSSYIGLACWSNSCAEQSAVLATNCWALGTMELCSRNLCESYCWWLKSCTTWDVWNPINNGIFSISTGAEFQPSTVPVSQYLIPFGSFWRFCAWRELVVSYHHVTRKTHVSVPSWNRIYLVRALSLV